MKLKIPSATATAEEKGAIEDENAKQLESIEKDLKAIVAAYYKPVTSLKDMLEKQVTADEDGKMKEEKRKEFRKNEGLFGWFQATFTGPESGIAWINFFDVIKIYNIYKDAILDRYHSKQKIRTYDLAKQWNIWKPLQPRHKPQSRRADHA